MQNNLLCAGNAVHVKSNTSYPTNPDIGNLKETIQNVKCFESKTRLNILRPYVAYEAGQHIAVSTRCKGKLCSFYK